MNEREPENGRLCQGASRLQEALYVAQQLLALSADLCSVEAVHTRAT